MQPIKEKKVKEKYYTVPKGDTLSEIAEQFGISYHKLAEVNHITNSN